MKLGCWPTLFMAGLVRRGGRKENELAGQKQCHVKLWPQHLLQGTAVKGKDFTLAEAGSETSPSPPCQGTGHLLRLPFLLIKGGVSASAREEPTRLWPPLALGIRPSLQQKIPDSSQGSICSHRDVSKGTPGGRICGPMTTSTGRGVGPPWHQESCPLQVAARMAVSGCSGNPGGPPGNARKGWAATAPKGAASLTCLSLNTVIDPHRGRHPRAQGQSCVC